MEASARVERVTPLELFFDLVFVFAITQVTTLLSADPTWAGLAPGADRARRALVGVGRLRLADEHAQPGGGARPDRDVRRHGARCWSCALAVPEAFGEHGVIFGVAYLVVRAMHIALYALAARGDPDLLGAVLRMTPSSTISGFLILGAGFPEGQARTTLWIARARDRLPRRARRPRRGLAPLARRTSPSGTAWS